MYGLPGLWAAAPRFGANRTPCPPTGLFAVSPPNILPRIYSVALLHSPGFHHTVVQ